MNTRIFLLPFLAFLLLGLMPPVSRAADPSNFPVTKSDQSLRTTVILDGGDWQTVKSSEAMPPAQGWSPATVPGITFLSPNWKPQFIWYRRAFVVPATWAGRRVFMTVGGARNAPQVYIDGKFAGGQQDGWTPLRVEITDFMHPGAALTLEIRCQDRSATVAPEKLTAITPGTDPAHQATIAPIGGYHDLMGIWDSVRLETTPPDEIVPSDLVVTPSVRRQSLTLRGRIDSPEKTLWVSARVLETDGTTALELPGGSVAADGTWQFAQAFLKAHDWSPEDPHLYSLELTLHQGGRAGPVLDTYRQRFGFKELWIVGPDFYLNGVKRHLLASATWPNADPMPSDLIHERVRSIKESNAICFRLHTGPWREEWLNAADEEGLLIVDEAAIYTDGDGLYAYNDPRFWQNYRDHVAGIIRRDRNHPSLALYSLENETLFMGNQRYDKDLPDQLGDVGRFARGIDPTHPITFEADRDPGGGADVIGLHYPHEPPGHVDYPNTADWLGGGSTTTDALGGMMGTTSGEFLWDRKKPLYIGEYLWDPQGDFSVASIFYGDKAYENRDKYHMMAQRTLYYEQTVAYRRAGVSGMSPWTTFGFGVAREANGLYENQQAFYRPVAAFLRDHGLRCFAGERRTLTFDVFNDSPSAKRLTLTLLNPQTKARIAMQRLSLSAGGYQAVQCTAPLPLVKTKTALNLMAVLDDGAGSITRSPVTLTIWPRRDLTIPKGCTVLAYDPSQTWPHSVTTLDALAVADVQKTILLIAPHALDVVHHAVNGVDVPVVGAADQFDTHAFHAFLERGGKALVLEQTTLEPLGLGIDLTDKRATMAFPLQASAPLWKNLAPDDLKFWRGDNYVTDRQVRRPMSGGARALAVTGGDAGLDTAPILDVPCGASGRVILMQTLAGAKRGTDPAAHQLLQNALDVLATPAPTNPRPSATLALDADSALSDRLKHFGLDVRTNSVTQSIDLSGVHVLALHGSPQNLPAAGTLAAFLARGGVVYWLNPDSASLHRQSAALGSAAGELDALPAVRGTAILRREDPLLEGVSREDLTYLQVSSDWNHPITWEADATESLFLPHSMSVSDSHETQVEPLVGDLHHATRGTVDGVPAVTFEQDGDMTLRYSAANPGLYRVTIPAMGSPANAKTPIFLVFVNDVFQTSFAASEPSWAQIPVVLSLAKGDNQISLRLTDGGTPDPSLGPVRVGAALDYPGGVSVLALPASLVTWRVGLGRVVLDGASWLTNATNAVRADRYANALFANLGASFAPAPGADGASSVAIPLTSFHLIGDSPYYDSAPDHLMLRSNGMVESQFYCRSADTLRVVLQGDSTPYQGVYCIVRVAVDGTVVGETEIRSPTASTFPVGPFPVSAGLHRLDVSFVNDASGGGEDRNLTVRGVSIGPGH